MKDELFEDIVNFLAHYTAKKKKQDESNAKAIRYNLFLKEMKKLAGKDSEQKRFYEYLKYEVDKQYRLKVDEDKPEKWVESRYHEDTLKPK